MVVFDFDLEEFNELQDICDYLLYHGKSYFSLKLVLLLRELQQGVFYDDDVFCIKLKDIVKEDPE